MTQQRPRSNSVYRSRPLQRTRGQQAHSRNFRKESTSPPSPSQRATSGGIRLGVQPDKAAKRAPLNCAALNVCLDCLHARDEFEEDSEFNNERLARWVSMYLAAELSRPHHGAKITTQSVNKRAKDAEADILNVIERLDADVRIVVLALFFINHLYSDTDGVKGGIDATVLTVGVILARRRLEGRLPDLFFHESTQEGKEWVWSQKDKLGDHFFVYGDRWKRWIRQLYSQCIFLEEKFHGIRLTGHPIPEVLHKLQDQLIEPIVRTRDLIQVVQLLRKTHSPTRWQPWD